VEGFIKNFKKHWGLYALLILPVAYIIIFNYIPMAGLQLAFKKHDPKMGLFGGKWVGFANFMSFFNSYMFWRLIKNTLALNFYMLIVGFPVPIILAISLNEVKNVRFKRIVQMVTYAPYFISTVVMVSIIFQVLSPYGGIVNQLISFLGGEPINFMGKPEYFRSIYVVSGLWQNMGYVSIIFIAALTGIDPTLYDSAKIDGASRVQKIWYIDIPGILPTAIIMMIMNMGSFMNIGFEKIFLMQNDMNATVSDVISTYVYEIGVIGGDYGFGTAVSMFNSVIGLMLLTFMNFLARRFSETSLW